MKSHTEKHKVKLNPCKYCGETEVEIVYNRFNNQDHCVAQCKCGAYVQRYCTNPLLAPELPDKCGIYDVKIKNCYDEIVEVKALYTYTVNEGFTFCRYGSAIINVIEWRYTSHEV